MDVPMDWLSQVGVGPRLNDEQKKIVKARIRQARLEKGWTQEHLGLFAGVAKESVSRWETSGSVPEILGILGFAFLFEKSPLWFLEAELPGQNSTDGVRSRVDTLVNLVFAGAVAHRVSLRVLFGLSDGEEDSEQPELDEYSASDGLDQPGWFPVAAAAGAGAEVPEEVLVDHVRLSPRWFREHALNPDQCDMISVTGDSMYPTLPDGCAILVDRGSVELRDGGVFVLRTADGLVVKRVRREDENDRWMLISDNLGWDPVPLDADAPVVGEVRWAGGLV